MRFVLLDFYYFENHPTVEALSKDRPHAVVTVQVENLQFALPLRTNLNHRFGFSTVDNCGVDYSKAVLIFNDSDISRDIRLDDNNEFLKIKENERKIVRDFTKYVDGYVKARRNGNTLPHRYRFSTLVNYDEALKCDFDH